MPVAKDGDLKTVSWVLTRDQDRRLRALHTLRVADQRRRAPHGHYSSLRRRRGYHDAQ